MKIPGPAGVLEAELTMSPNTVGGLRSTAATANSSGSFAVLCHPHPQYGGNMHDSVLACVESALLANGVSCLRFNFRGVGGSDGQYADGAGELEDLLAAAAWLRAEHSAEKLYLGGYSFGAAVVWQALPDFEAQRVLLVAPPTGMIDFQQPSSSSPVDVFTGDQDSYVDLARLRPGKSMRVHVLTGADHFFNGQLDTLEQRISSALSDSVSS